MENKISEALRNLRMQHNMSQEALAESLQVSRQAVSSWEPGKTQPNTDTLIAISSLFQVSVNEIISNGLSKAWLKRTKKA